VFTLSIWSRLEEVINLATLVDRHLEELESDPLTAKIINRYYQGATLEELKQEFSDIEVIEMEE
jgi:hypothetical protein